METAAAVGIAIGLLMVFLLSRLQPVSGGGTSPAPEGSGPLPSGAAPAPLVLPGGHNEWDDLIRRALAVAGFEPNALARYAVLVKAIILQESGWNPQARGDYDPNHCPAAYRTYAATAGYCALGFGQIHRFWHPDLAAGYNLMDGTRNIAAMAVLLFRLRAAVGDDVQRIAAAYNGGTAAGLAWPHVSAQVDRYVAAVANRWTLWASQAGIA